MMCWLGAWSIGWLVSWSLGLVGRRLVGRYRGLVGWFVGDWLVDG